MIPVKTQWLRNQREMILYWFHLEWRVKKEKHPRLVLLLEENQMVLLQQHNWEGDRPDDFWLDLLKDATPIPT